jgi:hypothetical protein
MWVIVLAETLVVIIDRNGECLLGVLLADDVFVEALADLRRREDIWSRSLRCGDVRGRIGVLSDAVELFLKNGGADIDTFVTNVNAGTCDELFHL